MEIISLQAAITLGLKQYFTGKACRRGHVCARSVAARRCTICSSEREKRLRVENPSRCREVARRWRQKNKKKTYQYGEKWRKKNLSKVRETQRAWRAKNPDKCHAYNSNWKKYHNEEVRTKARDRSNKLRAAYRALIELGIEI